MNIELTDELLRSSLSVRDLPLPPDLRQAVHATIAGSLTTPRRAPLRLSPAVRLILLAALTLLIVAAGSLWLGNRLPSVIVTPTNGPSPTSGVVFSPQPSPSSEVAPSATPSGIAFQSSLWGYSLKLPVGWSVVSQGQQTPDPTTEADLLTGQGVTMKAWSEGLLSDCSVNFDRCALPVCSPVANSCPTVLGRLPSATDTQEWMVASLARVDDPCSDEPNPMTVAGYSAAILLSTCPTNSKPFLEIRLVASNGVGYAFRFEGTIDSTSDLEILSNALFQVPPWSTPPAPTPVPPPTPTPQATPEPTAPPLTQSYTSGAWGYSIEYPEGWGVTPAHEIANMGKAGDVFDTRGLHVAIREQEPLSQCSADFSQCKPVDVICCGVIQTINRPATKAEQKLWLEARLTDVSQDCTDVPTRSDILVGSLQGREIQCETSNGPIADTYVVNNDIGYGFSFQGDATQNLITAVLATVRFT